MGAASSCTSSLGRVGVDSWPQQVNQLRSACRGVDGVGEREAEARR